MRVVKGFGQEARELDRLAGALAADVRGEGTTRGHPGPAATRDADHPRVRMVAVLALGGWLALNDHISYGTFLAFSTYMLLITPPIRQLAAILTVGQLARAGAERIYDLLDSTPLVQDAPEAIELEVPHGEVQFDNVSFGYTSTDRVLNGFSLTVAPGETVALVGSSGSGKSTVGLLLPRFYDVHGGAVTIDGVDVRGVTMQSLRRSIGVVFEDSFLFSDTITNNIAFGRPGATQEEVVAAARAAEAHEFIERLPFGYDTVVGEQGLTLSGGQRQRVALARALLSDPRILLLDDATSSVDARIEEEIHATLRRIASTRTTILIAHRRSTLTLADRIVVVDNGRVLDSGTNEELWARCRLYRLLLSGPGDDAEGLDAPVVENVADEPQVGGITPSAWRGLEEQVLQLEQIADATRPASPAAMRFGGGGGGGGGGWMNNMGGALAPTPELLAQVAALPPADADPNVDVAFEGKPAPDFSFFAFLSRYRAWLLIGLGLVALDAVCTLAGPLLVRYGIDVNSNGSRALWAASIAFFLITCFDWWVMWAEARVLGRTSERLLHALRIKVFAHLQRLGVDYYENEMAGRIMTRMTTDIDALSQLLQNGLVNALVNLVTFVGVGIALVFINPTLALLTAAVLPPLAVATIWFRSAVDQGLRVGTRAHRRREREPARGPVGCAGVAGVRAGGAQPGAVRGGRGRLPRRPHPRPAPRRDLLPVRRLPFRDRRGHRARCGQCARVERHDAGRQPHRVPALHQLVLRADPAALAGVRLVPAGSGGHPAHHRAARHARRRCPFPWSRSPVPDLAGDVVLDDVRFRYANATDEALRGVDMRVRAGETVALVGETGAGKSTVVKLVARFYDPTSGAVCVDGVPVNDLRPGRRSTSSSASSRRRRSCSRARSATTSRTAGRKRPTPRSRPPRAPSARTTSSPRCRADTCNG